jgi:hypothetical protein
VKEEVKDEMLTLYGQQTSFGESLSFIAEVVCATRFLAYPMLSPSSHASASVGLGAISPSGFTGAAGVSSPSSVAISRSFGYRR